MIKVLIINFNRLTLPMNMANYLHSCNLEPIFLDNCSTYEPLLKYYDDCNYEVIRLDKNYGHKVVWEANILKRLNITDEFIITDSDLDISMIPKDFLSVLRKGLDKYPSFVKCGFSLKIDDLPSCNFSESIKETEGNYWKKPLDDMYFDAQTDTTFCLYRTKVKSFNALRTNSPYSARHMPWYYESLNSMSEEDIYYLKSIKTSTWYSQKLVKLLNIK
jgi:hypothetical protein